MDYVDNYCERLGPGLWAEPVNALTNLAFLVAAGVLGRLLVREPRRAPARIWLLPLTTAAVGLCSLAFHTYATRFTGMLDSLSIAVFILVAAVIAVRQVWSAPWRWAWLAAPGVLAFVTLCTIALGTAGVRSALSVYLSALLVLLGFSLAMGRWAPAAVRRFASLLSWAALLFAMSLTLRTLDGPLCAGFPAGTHFLWHCLNGTVLFLVSYTVLRCWQAGLETGRAGHPLTMSDTTHTADDDDREIPPGPTDQGRTGGMATREVAPDVVKRHQHESED